MYTTLYIRVQNRINDKNPVDSPSQNKADVVKGKYGLVLKCILPKIKKDTQTYATK
jgi:hypothetical protein